MPEHEPMESEHMDENEKENKCESSSYSNEERGNPDPADCDGTSAKESECVTKSISFLPRNKEELERTIKNIQGTITGDILPRLHKCLASTVIILFGAQQVCGTLVFVEPCQTKSPDCFWLTSALGFSSISAFHSSSPFSFLIIFRFMCCN